MRLTMIKRGLSYGQHGFTLIELSIVLVVIGLVVGGILVGRDLISAATVRSQISQIEEFEAATKSFQLKYGYMPGDMPPSQASQLGFFAFTGTYAGKGCGINAYGNNDGIINTENESYPFWSHLSDAGLVQGNYGGTGGNLLLAAAPVCNGSPTSGQPIVAPFDNSKFQPIAKLGNKYIYVKGNMYTAPNNNVEFSDVKKSNMFAIYQRSISAYDMYRIDSKIDDGLAATGDLRVYSTADEGAGLPYDAPPCTTSGINPIAYNLLPSEADKKSCDAAFLF